MLLLFEVYLLTQILMGNGLNVSKLYKESCQPFKSYVKCFFKCKNRCLNIGSNDNENQIKSNQIRKYICYLVKITTNFAKNETIFQVMIFYLYKL